MERKLPVLATLVAAFELCRDHAAYALKIMTPWFLITLIAPYFLAVTSTDNPAEGGSTSLHFWEVISALLYVIAWGSIAVLWHWRVLRDDSYSRQAVTVDRRVWFYILRGILISIIVGGAALASSIPVLLLTSVLSGGAIGTTVFFTMAGCVVIIVGIVAARLSIALPAIALDVPDFGLGDAWGVTMSNGFRLLVVTFLPLMPLYLLTWGLDVLGAEQSDLYQGEVSWFFVHLLFQCTDFAFGLLGLSVLSLTYAFFVEKRGTSVVPTS